MANESHSFTGTIYVICLDLGIKILPTFPTLFYAISEQDIFFLFKFILCKYFSPLCMNKQSQGWS